MNESGVECRSVKEVTYQCNTTFFPLQNMIFGSIQIYCYCRELVIVDRLWFNVRGRELIC